MAIITPSSRFRQTSLVLTRDGKETYGRVEGLESLKNLEGTDFGFFRVDSCDAGRPDLLANRFYGNPHLEWIIVIANHPKNPLNWPKAGETIKVPTNSFVRTLF